MTISASDQLYRSIGGTPVTAQELADFVGSSGETTVTAAQISDATAVGRSVLTAADAATARTAIGAGSSNLAIGTTASTAKAGNWQPGPSDMSVSQTVKNFLGAADTDGCQTQIGGTSTGKLLFTAASAAGACSAIQAISWTAGPTSSQRGGVLQQAAIADAGAAPTQAEFNAVLAALRASGLLAT